MVQTQGKQNKVVPTLLTQEMVAAMDLLLKHRKKCGLKDSNQYLFATQGEGHLPSWQVIQAMATAPGCKQPELMTSSCLRKYIATVSQVIDLSNHELEWLSSHLAHDIKTHKQFYRQQDATLELAKVSRLLLAAEADDVYDEEDEEDVVADIDDDIDMELTVAEDSEKDDQKLEVSTPEKTVKVNSNIQKQKMRWSEEENNCVKSVFAKYIKDKCMPPGWVIKKAVDTVLTRRAVPQVRTKINNIITNKQKLI